MPPSGLRLEKCYNRVVGNCFQNSVRLHRKASAPLSLHGRIYESPQMMGKRFDELVQSVCMQLGQLDDFTFVGISSE
jgi:hypothetical protein